MSSHGIAKSPGLFALAGLCRIGRGSLVRLFIREDGRFWFDVIGGLICPAGVSVIMYRPRA